ncbi:MAG: glycosyltransferase family 39 protein [Bacteroidota bacterium]
MSKKRIDIGDLVLFGTVSLVGFLLFLGAPPLFDWDEINFAESAREMLVTGNYFQVQVNYQPFWEKPPLFFWLQALCMQVFGVGEFAARIPNALIGMATVLTLYVQGCRLKNPILGRLLAGLYLGTLLPVIYFKSGIIDPTFNYFIFLGLITIWQFDQKWITSPEEAKQDAAPWAAGFWIGLATLTKGPVALLMVLLIYGVYKLWVDKLRLPWLAAGKFLLAWLILVGSWYGLETLIHGPWFIEQFIEYQLGLFSQPVASHGQPFYYHFVVFLLGCFPISAFTFRGMFVKLEDTRLQRFMTVWFWVVMVVFSLATTKIVHYSSLLYFPAVFLSALYVYQLLKDKAGLKWESYVLYGVGMLLWGLLPSLLNVVVNQLDLLLPYLDGTAREAIKIEVAWTGWEWIWGAIFLLGMGWNLRQLVQGKYITFVYLQLVLCLLFVNGMYKTVVPKVAVYTQGPPQEFFSQFVGQDVYLFPAGYKSYLPYFYGRIKPHTHPEGHSKEWLANGQIDKAVYAAAPISVTKKSWFKKKYANLERLYEKGGFVFFQRKLGVRLRAGE